MCVWVGGGTSKAEINIYLKRREKKSSLNPLAFQKISSN